MRARVEFESNDACACICAVFICAFVYVAALAFAGLLLDSFLPILVADFTHATMAELFKGATLKRKDGSEVNADELKVQEI